MMMQDIAEVDPVPVLAARGALVSVVIPSWSGDVERVRRSLEAQTFRDYELCVVCGVSPRARALNLGIARTRGELILFLDDDIYFGHEHVLGRLVAALLADPTIGIVGSSLLIPPDVTWLQRRVVAEVPRWASQVTDEDTESNPPLDRYGSTEVRGPCGLVRRPLLEGIGTFDERLVTGEDTDLYHRIRRAGFRLVIPRQCWIYHPPPDTVRSLLRKHFFYGVGHAQEAQKSPERRMDIVPLDRLYGKLLVALSPLFLLPSFFVSIYHYPTRHLRIGFRPLKALSTYATLFGYTWGWFRARYRA